MVKIGVLFDIIISRLYTCYSANGFCHIGRKSVIRPFADLILGKRYINVGEKTIIGRHVQLTAWGNHNGKSYTPLISIGANCQIGAYNHITAVNKIIIGDGVLTGKFVTISDNSHGIPGDNNDADISPVKRIIYSKGEVEIGDNVWIGDKATILPNVRIGCSSIVGANSVVTKDVPAYTIVAGNPAKIIRKIK